MDYTDNFNPAYQDDTDLISDSRENNRFINDTKKSDRGYNVVWRYFPRSDGRMKRTKVEFYTTSGVGSNIRDAETGAYYVNKVGSLDEDLFFKVSLATGECKSLNNSNILFYTSPNHYMSHMRNELNQNTIALWESKRDNRIKELSSIPKTSNMSYIVS